MTPGDTYTFLANVTSGSASFDRAPAGGTYYWTSAISAAGYTTHVRYNGGTGHDLTMIVDAPPTATTIADDAIAEDGIYHGTITVGDDLMPVDGLSVTATSNAQSLVPDANITIGSTGSARAITIAPAPDAFGVATITVRIADANQAIERTFQLTVNGVNDAPTIDRHRPEDDGRRHAGADRLQCRRRR